MKNYANRVVLIVQDAGSVFCNCNRRMAMTASSFQEDGEKLSIKKSPGCSDLKNDPIIVTSRNGLCDQM
ncbi:hypothetical protein T4E_11062 [Trichinella pseudospiralis]|uniref:Uncharacterized protein n=1 Tax=Trichinella pseudospiralis TaxID=6337 RepID=A0A0V0Y338_TRIPS|nr:hypothetical protein T4E_11062 [Trichinella pseudospiralis]